MKTVLAIAACGPRLELALGTSPDVTGVVALAGQTPRSELVMAAVDLLLRGAGIDREALDGVVASRGPGSFTGVRVALATAQGIAAALALPAHGFSSLLAQAARADAPECLAVQPARRGFAYAQEFSRAGGRLAATGEPSILAVEALAGAKLPVVAPVGFPLPPGTPLAAAPRSTAEALLVLLAAEPHPDPATLAPIYMEPPAATPPTGAPPPWPPSPKVS
ncbi:MAG: tRNA (adenosine(37)-N6)-threonylcarbamoyltransferase complex dimerization subunit type 1 TsaB [Thermoanaerobaculaceae bacterium]|nr:tRNA (adenosine(37)-N6)-threonylcarbamoyltransferase complex dimerization subunit type 1 TsaB [Thermoanaerobaculaceae bacterium]